MENPKKRKMSLSAESPTAKCSVFLSTGLSTQGTFFLYKRVDNLFGTFNEIKKLNG